MKVRFTIDNFMAIGHAEIDLRDKGLVLIQGVNEGDTSAVSNGAGKSTIADALFWCLWGEVREDVSPDKVVNRATGKDCQVQAFVEDGDTTYEITRWRKKKGMPKTSGLSFRVIQSDGTITDKTGGTDKLTQAEIERSLGCDAEIFRAAVYAQQENMPDLPSKTDTELKRLIEEASGITVLLKAYEVARGRLKDVERAQDLWRLEHVRLEQDVRTTQERIEDLKMRRSTFETKRMSELRSLETDFNQARERAKRAKVKRDEIDPVSVQAKMDKLDEAINAVHEQNEQESVLNVAYTEAASRHMLVKTEYNRLVIEAQDAKRALERINDRIGVPCGECGKAYCEDDLGDATKLAKEKLRIAVTRAREKQLDVEELSKLETDAKTVLDTFRASKTDIRAVSDERRRLAVLLVDRANAERDLDRDVREATRLKEAHTAKKAEENPYGTLLDNAEIELHDHMKAHRASEERGVDLERRLQVAKEVVKVYGAAGVRAHILDTVTPYLNSRTSEYLGVLSDGNISAVWSTIQINSKGEPVEKFAISVEKVNDGDTFGLLSGGEKRKVRLATALALQDLVASRATKPWDVWIGDEIDDAMDSAGLERLMTVLESKARERGTVAVVSHNDLKDWIRESTTVTRKGGYSTVTGALAA